MLIMLFIVVDWCNFEIDIRFFEFILRVISVVVEDLEDDMNEFIELILIVIVWFNGWLYVYVLIINVNCCMMCLNMFF